ncbi:hypothetical protein [Streptomyces sp. NPDC059850]|uniref:hypothetical protein n=1 Tax=Streptomyces sp. NPDC059850 TaxID=3346970 RepID=UPI00366077B3
MEIAELVLKYIEALVWPAVTVGLVWGLRSHLREAFARMSRLETPAGAIEFETQARDVLNQAEAATIAPPPPVTPTPPPYPWPPTPSPAGEAPPAYDAVQEGLGPSPRETPTPTPPTAQPQPQPQGPQIPTQQAPPPSVGPWASPPYTPQADAPEPPPWREQLSEARTMVDASPVGAIVAAWNALLSAPQGVLPPDIVDVLNRLRTLRNQAVHHADTVTPAAARDYIETCLRVARLVTHARHP